MSNGLQLTFTYINLIKIIKQNIEINNVERDTQLIQHVKNTTERNTWWILHVVKIQINYYSAGTDERKSIYTKVRAKKTKHLYNDKNLTISRLACRWLLTTVWSVSIFEGRCIKTIDLTKDGMRFLPTSPII